MISTNPVALNTQSSICGNLDPDSNVTKPNDLHQEKQLSPKTSTEAGILLLTEPV
jgi:hypothetical protein